ncbi:bacteriochlorophyll 4-vinyl reductase [Methylocystis sp. SB2]|uniref:bacteriochlorophyll 4-vinyl reductase n=1 Tax=Methylocystis sp. (strain SB2) TaxID=743836 RepID=UPI0003FDA5D3|nr:bacteriochlorophyll 4-vinyl reductase [Methylocystis sp. SB2]ULO25317.1 bacteriochlorophyll 4-vinyl reductase [Methylocystis sp. SB2]
MSIARAEGETARLGLIGPNAITQMAAALSDACGAPLRLEVFEDAGLARYLCAPPTQMISEDDVAQLHRAAIDRLGETKAAAISREAGRRTGDYLLANRIPALAQRVLKFLPRPLAARILVAAIARHAWTFSGSGEFTYEFAPNLRLCIARSPICKGLRTEAPACAYFAATFERVFGEMLGPTLRVTEVECAATGAAACVFEARW